jgi:hypothetical protein
MRLRIDARLVQDEAHVAQRVVGDRRLAEHGRIEVDEERRGRIEELAGVEQVQRARQRLHMQPVGGRNAVEEDGRRNGSPSRNGRSRPSKAAIDSLPPRNAKIGWKALFSVEPPDARRGTVILANDMGEANAARHGQAPGSAGTHGHGGTQGFTGR